MCIVTKMVYKTQNKKRKRRKRQIKTLFRNLAGAILALTLCITLIPTQTVKAESAATSGTNSGPVAILVNYDCTSLTDEQLMEAYFGEWDNSASLTKNHVKIDYESDDGEDIMEVDADWEFVGSVILEGLVLTEDDYMMKFELGKELDTKVKALKFKTDDAEFLVHRGFDLLWGARALFVEMTTEDGTKTTAHFFNKFVGWKEVDGEKVPDTVRVLEALAAAKEAVVDTPVDTTEDVDAEGTTVEEPKAEITVEEPTAEDTTTKDPTAETQVKEPETEEVEVETTVEDNNEVVEKTKDGRPVYVGETVYVVKKGDCLWAIARTLLGDGRRYNELFVRNGEIIEKAELIFPGQEVIVPTNK